MDLRAHQLQTTPANYKMGTEESECGYNCDPLFDRDWEVFVVRHDPATGTLVTNIAGCDDASD